MKAHSILDTIGHTPHVRIQRLFGKDAHVWIKSERSNPGGSIKDRIALAMVEAAEKSGALQPGGTIVEPTSGKTGIGLAMVAAVKDYKLVLVMPDSMSIERRRLMLAYGASFELTPREKGMKGCIARALELIAATPFSHDIDVEGSAIDGLDIGNTKHLPPTLLAQYHFDLGNSNFDPFIGLGLNYTKFFDTSASGVLKSTLQALNVATAKDNVDLKLKDSWGLALQAGVNYKLDKNWGLHFMVSKMDIDTVGEVRLNGATIQSVDVQIDPLVVMAGVRWCM